MYTVKKNFKYFKFQFSKNTHVNLLYCTRGEKIYYFLCFSYEQLRKDYNEVKREKDHALNRFELFWLIIN